jgi:dihydroxyacetone kinase-like protein
MLDTIGYMELARMLLAAAAHVKAQHETLSQLDSHGGDGDHGATMVRAMGLMEKTVAAPAAEDVAALLHDIGWAIMGVDGGATGPLFGALFMGMSEAAAQVCPGVGSGRLDAPGLARMLESGLAGVQKQTRARVGDKTMMDALVPAVEAARAAACEGLEIAAVFERAAEAAASGAASTKTLQARFGRAKNLGERSIGAQDPGATSVALLFAGLASGLKISES